MSVCWTISNSSQQKFHSLQIILEREKVNNVKRNLRLQDSRPKSVDPNRYLLRAYDSEPQVKIHRPYRREFGIHPELLTKWHEIIIFRQQWRKSSDHQSATHSEHAGYILHADLARARNQTLFIIGIAPGVQSLLIYDNR